MTSLQLTMLLLSNVTYRYAIQLVTDFKKFTGITIFNMFEGITEVEKFVTERRR